jgi:hypothetical protein
MQVFLHKKCWLTASGLLLTASFSFLNAQVKESPSANLPPTVVQAEVMQPKKQSKIAPALMALSKEEKSTSSSPQQKKTTTPKDMPSLQKQLYVVAGKVLVEIIANSENTEALQATLKSMGMRITGVYERQISGWLPTTALEKIEFVTAIHYMAPAAKPKHNNKRGASMIGTAGEGDKAMRADLARKLAGVNGKGIKIGVMSDSYDALGGAAKGIAGGDLPGLGNPNGFNKPVQVLRDYLEKGDDSLPLGTDEGRAMMELIHDVAPGAELFFYTAFEGQAAFAEGILNLKKAGCNIIVDDVTYFEEPFFQDGIIAQAVEKVSKEGATYFSSAGNSAASSYEDKYFPSNFEPLGKGTGTAHNFSGRADSAIYLQPLFVPTQGGTALVSLQWDQPFLSVSGKIPKTDIDAYLLDSAGNVVAVSAEDNASSGTPSEFVFYQNNTTSERFYLAIVKYSGPEVGRLKYVLFGDELFYRTTPAIPGILSSTIIGHHNAASGIATGAAFYQKTPEFGVDPAVIERFSSLGGTRILLKKDGTRTHGWNQLRLKPEIVAPDGTNTSFFYSDSKSDADTLPNFFGTSAAAPHAAAVAALMIEAGKKNGIATSPAFIKALLAASAKDMDNPATPTFDKGFDFKTGFGFVNAENAVKWLLPFSGLENNNALAANGSRVSEINPTKGVSLSNNPSNGKFDVILNTAPKEKMYLSIYNVYGVEVYNKQINNAYDGGRINVNIAHHPAGVYMVQLHSANNTSVQTLTAVKE